jgi:hypothetical protein
MTESRRLRFDLYSWGTLTVLLVGTGVYFAFHLAWNLILLSFLLVSAPSLLWPDFTERSGSRLGKFRSIQPHKGLRVSQSKGELVRDFMAAMKTQGLVPLSVMLRSPNCGNLESYATSKVVDRCCYQDIRVAASGERFHAKP